MQKLPSSASENNEPWRSYLETDLTPDEILNLLIPELLRLGVNPDILLNQINTKQNLMNRRDNNDR